MAGGADVSGTRAGRSDALSFGRIRLILWRLAWITIFDGDGMYLLRDGRGGLCRCRELRMPYPTPVVEFAISSWHCLQSPACSSQLPLLFHYDAPGPLTNIAPENPALLFEDFR